MRKRQSIFKSPGKPLLEGIPKGEYKATPYDSAARRSRHGIDLRTGMTILQLMSRPTTRAMWSIILLNILPKWVKLYQFVGKGRPRSKFEKRKLPQEVVTTDRDNTPDIQTFPGSSGEVSIQPGGDI